MPRKSKTSPRKMERSNRVIITDFVLDPGGSFGTALAVKLDAKDDEVERPRRGRPLDPTFDAAWVATCHAVGVPLALNEKTIELGLEIFTERSGPACEQDSVRQRIKLMIKDSKEFRQI